MARGGKKSLRSLSLVWSLNLWVLIGELIRDQILCLFPPIIIILMYFFVSFGHVMRFSFLVLLWSCFEVFSSLTNLSVARLFVYRISTGEYSACGALDRPIDRQQ